MNRHNAILISVSLNRACFGFTVCSRCGVLECAPYGRRMVGSTAASARRFLRSLDREQWSAVSEFVCPVFVRNRRDK